MDFHHESMRAEIFTGFRKELAVKTRRPSASGGLTVERDTSISPRGCEAFCLGRFGKPLDAPDGFFSLGVCRDTCLGLDGPDLDFAIKRAVHASVLSWCGK